MELSEKLKKLQDDARFGDLSYDDIEDGFNRCIEDAEFFEDNKSESEKLVKKLLDDDLLIWDGRKLVKEYLNKK